MIDVTQRKFDKYKTIGLPNNKKKWSIADTFLNTALVNNLLAVRVDGGTDIIFNPRVTRRRNYGGTPPKEQYKKEMFIQQLRCDRSTKREAVFL